MHTKSLQFYRWHPALKASVIGPVVRSVPLHLQQSDLDGACGPHCALMALMLFGIVRRVDLDGLPKARKRRLSSMWKLTEDRYFVGSYARHLRAALEPYARNLICTVRRKDCIPHALLVLDDAGVGIVQIGHADFNHWVLAVGIGGVSRRNGLKPACMMMIDPGRAPIPFSPWNAMLSVKADTQDLHAYDTTDGRCRVTVDTILALRYRA